MGKIVCLVGKSGSGKSALASELKKSGYRVLDSYTTRPKRHPQETGHIFIDKATFDSLRHDAVAYTEFNGYEYMATRQQINHNDIYIIDPDGAHELVNELGEENVYIVEIFASKAERYRRMLKTRGEKEASSRIKYDEGKFRSMKTLNIDLSLQNENQIDFHHCLCHIEDMLRMIRYATRK